MIKSVYKKILIIFLMAILFLMLFNNNCSWALGDVTNDPVWLVWKPTLQDDSTLTGKIEVVLGVIRIIGIIVSVATLSVIGIKFMLGSIEEKANYKQAMKPWLIGATMVFAMTTIPTIIYDVTTGFFVENNSTVEGITGNYLAGFYKGVTYLYEEAQKGKDITSLSYNMYAATKKQKSQFWNGYKDIGSIIYTMNKNYGRGQLIRDLYNKISSISKGEITKANIESEYEECLKKLFNAITNAEKERGRVLRYMLYRQMVAWNVESGSFTRYKDGFVDAGNWVGQYVYRNINQVDGLELINTQKNKIENITNTATITLPSNNYKVYKSYIAEYWEGYNEFLEIILENCGREEHLQTCIYNYESALYAINGLGEKTVEKIDALINHKYPKEEMGLDKDGPLAYAICTIYKAKIKYGSFAQDASAIWQNGVESGTSIYLDGCYDAIRRIATNEKANRDTILSILKQDKTKYKSTYWEAYKETLTEMMKTLDPKVTADILYEYFPDNEGGPIKASNIANKYLNVLSKLQDGSYSGNSTYDNQVYTIAKRILELQIQEWQIHIYGH